MELLIGIFSFATIFLVVLGVAALMGFFKSAVDVRIDSINKTKPSAKNSFVLPTEDRQTMMASLGEQVAPKDPEKRSASKQRLAMAGYYSDQAFSTYWGIKIVMVLFMPVLVYSYYILIQSPLTQAMIPSCVAIGCGLFLPDLFLFYMKRRRHEQIFCGLPDALDLLVVCIEAGLGLDAALKKVSEEFHMSNRILSTELNLTCATIRMGRPRSEALHDLGERTGVTDLKALSAVLTQADRFGTSLAKALRVHSDDLRTRRRQRAEELAAKTSVKLIFPLVLFIFPAIFVVLVGPAAIKIIEKLM